MEAALILTFLLPFILRGSEADDYLKWGAQDDYGPVSWKNTCIRGTRQSPIDIRATDVDIALVQDMLFVHYDIAGPVNVTNSGYTVEGEGFEKRGRRQPFIQGGGLKYRYRLVEFHLHWSQHDINGSEHRIGGLQYAAELHLVHVREGLSLEEALKRPDGVAVLGVLILIGPDGGPLAKFSSTFKDVIFPGNHSTAEGFPTRALLPANTRAYYRYDGSITVPECNEAVVWTVFSEPISMTRSQMEDLRKLQSNKGGRVQSNVRPVQRLNGRRVLYKPSSFNKKLICDL